MISDMTEARETITFFAKKEIDVAGLYLEHLHEKLSRFQKLLAGTGYHDVVISAGEVRLRFQDDLPHPFKANPYFKEWVPLTERPGSFLQIKQDTKQPRLFLLCEEDIWHTAPQSLPDGFEPGLEIVEYTVVDDIIGAFNLDSKQVAYIGETNLLKVAPDHWNSAALLNPIDYQRRYKTPYEHHCVRQANRLAVPAHQAAQAAFMDGASELATSAAYLAACHSSENAMPYPIIAGINEHAAVLHHFKLDNHAPETPRSFLIDAGVAVNGYASDITRTYAYDPNSELAEMIQMMDNKQQELVAAGRIGKNPLDLHILSHQKIAEVLVQFGIVTTSVEEAVDTGITQTFYPHGLGHHLGVNVHDKGTRLANPQGEIIPPPKAHPTLRHTIPMVANQIHTVEPGLYFIPALLEKCRQSKHAAKLNWSRIEDFIPYGGIRIEDNVVVHEDGTLENLTRDAFRESPDT